MKTRWMAGAVVAALALGMWGTSPDFGVVAGSQTGYFGSGHDAGQGHAAPVPTAEAGRA
jgi:hypothetical protein